MCLDVRANIFAGWTFNDWNLKKEGSNWPSPEKTCTQKAQLKYGLFLQNIFQKDVANTNAGSKIKNFSIHR